MQTKDFHNEPIRIASNHLNLAKQEIEECANLLYDKLQQLLSRCQDKESHQLLGEAMAALQFQDILTQRLKKLDDFLGVVDQQAQFGTNKRYLEEFAWENEVDQSDIDQMFNEYKG